MAKMIVVACALLASTPAFAQVTSITTNNPAPKGGQDLNKIVCEVDQTTGSRLGARKVCKTVLEWQQGRQEQRGDLEKIQRIQNIHNPG